ncbi:MAG: tRNA-dihydrouridine synthase, partial [Candidatus Sumerlaeia bacterium]|nr:tRNA-dihydrouridine synthase [Candidatus Sumerlaeia bacterium]
VEEGILAESLGFNLVATTLSGYTSYTIEKARGPDLELIEELSRVIKIPVLAEGRIETPEQAAEAIKRGAWAVVVGTAITRPQIITQRFVKAIKQSFPEKQD